jgi:hypothetical protein
VFHQLSAEHMIEQIDALHEAENRRKNAIPSTPAFHQAAQDEKGHRRGDMGLGTPERRGYAAELKRRG